MDCSVLNNTRTDTHCNTLQHTVTRWNHRNCNTLPHTATSYCTRVLTTPHCNTLQHTATHCNTLQVSLMDCSVLNNARRGVTAQVKVCCSVLQCVAVCCSVLQCVAVRHTATHCNTMQVKILKSQLANQFAIWIDYAATVEKWLLKKYHCQLFCILCPTISRLLARLRYFDKPDFSQKSSV